MTVKEAQERVSRAAHELLLSGREGSRQYDDDDPTLREAEILLMGILGQQFTLVPDDAEVTRESPRAAARPR
jgi:hypothetical protein